ncbi:GatB/YqeY domain-containing protein [Pseudovirgaria hyperparasitica]|uniref:Altered inheritance of mitochondria protein 41 n=1 Tax=Pseudovirgaria hyperparasitica TaxID=470096 RepID=A0A6A6WLP1_9PEZI|nr:GatB/YqeY domain-containing protein [Pseudovirgaria hyperparasitica]KAF2763082.1 GatB/YqeY domain-containing protein [Pseudovirgaria hyperparasitica]
MATRRIYLLTRPHIHTGQSSICLSPRTQIAVQSRHNSTISSPVLSRLRPDLKKAMQNKDKTRLNVLRGILASVNDASKIGKPVENDAALLALFKQEIKMVTSAKAEALQAGRTDLVEKQDETISVLKEYSGMVSLVSEDEIRAVVTEVVQELGKGAHVGSMIGKAKEKLSGRAVEMSDVAKAIKAVIS